MPVSIKHGKPRTKYQETWQCTICGGRFTETRLDAQASTRNGVKHHYCGECLEETLHTCIARAAIEMATPLPLGSTEKGSEWICERCRAATTFPFHLVADTIDSTIGTQRMHAACINCGSVGTFIRAVTLDER